MRATTWRLLLGIAVASGVVSWALLRLWTNDRGALPEVPWPTAVVIALFGVSVLFSALRLRPRIRRKDGHRPVEPLVSARFGVLSLASSRAGALFVGVYGGFLATALADLDIDYRKHIALVSGLCVVAGGILIAGGLVLEHACRLPPEDPE